MSTAKGNAFRDQVALLLEAAGYRNVQSEKLIAGKRVDIYGEREVGFSVQRIAIETKDYTSTLPSDQTFAFTNEYGAIRRQGHIDQGVLVASGGLSAQSVQQLEAARSDGLVGLDFHSFQRRIFGPDDYLRALIDEYDREGLEHYYVPARIKDGPLSDHIDSWLARSLASPLVVMGGYGSGKSTFALHLAAKMARKSLVDPTVRIPVRVPLGQIVDENSLEGLFGKLFTDTYRVETYNWPLFKRLNALGRFLVIFDGFDEMKHGMTYAAFQRQFDRLLTLAESKARILILGRDTAFTNEREFLSIIEGRVTTAAGNEVALQDRPRCENVKLEPFTLPEAQGFVRGYFPLLANRDNNIDHTWIEGRLNTMLSGRYDDLIVRPVHAQMLCRIASDKDERIDQMSEFNLYDRFIHQLLRREVTKEGRYPNFDETVRRKANSSLSWWLLAQGGASTTSIASAPLPLFKRAAENVPHSFDDIGLVRELSQGCLIEKAGGTIYFGHRSIQEFLAAEYLFETNLSPYTTKGLSEIDAVCNGSTKEVVHFLGDFYHRRTGARERAISIFSRFREHKGSLDLDKLGPYVTPYQMIMDETREDWAGSSDFWLDYVARFGIGRGLNANSGDHLNDTLRGNHPDEVLLAATLIFCIELSVKPDAMRPADAIALFFNPPQLTHFVAETQRTPKPVYVSSKQGLFTYLLLDSSECHGAHGEERTIRLNIHRLISRSTRLLGYAPSVKAWLDVVADRKVPVLTAPSQRVLSALDLSRATSEKLRPFFEPSVRHRLLPLEVDVKGGKSQLRLPQTRR